MFPIASGNTTPTLLGSAKLSPPRAVICRTVFEHARDVLKAEYLLLDTVLEDMKVLLAQIAEWMTLTISRDDVHNYTVLSFLRVSELCEEAGTTMFRTMRRPMND